MGDNIAPGGNLDLHAQVTEETGHIGNGFFQGQILAFDKGAATFRGGHQQGLGVLVQIFDSFYLKGGPGLDHFLDGTAVDGAEDSLAVFFRQVFRQFNLDLEDLVIAVLRVDNVVLG